MGRKKQSPEASVKRTLILKTAGEMFISQGFSEVSMDAIAEAVPVSKRTLYNHFEDKGALFIAVMQQRCGQIFDAFEQALRDDGRDVAETLTQLGRGFLNVVFEPDAVNLYRTAITESVHFPEMGKLFYETGPRNSIAMLASYLEKLQERGVIRVGNPELAAGMFLNMLTGRMQMRCLLGLKKEVSEREKTEILRQAVRIFLGGITP